MQLQLKTAESNLSSESAQLQRDQQTASDDARQCTSNDPQGSYSSIACSYSSSAAEAVTRDIASMQSDESEIQNYERDLQAAG